MRKVVTVITILCVILISFFPISHSTDRYSSQFSEQNEYDKIEVIIQRINRTQVKTYLQELVAITEQYGDRRTGSEGSFYSAKYIKKSLTEMNGSLRVRESHWRLFGDLWSPGFYADNNIIAELPGTLENASTIVFLVHHDTIPNSLGADDDGSGVAALLAVAQVLSVYRFNHTIVFCSASGEKVGWLGDYHEARLFYEAGTDVIAAITADAIGYMPDVEDKHHNSVVLFKPERSQWIADKVVSVFDEYQDMIGIDTVRLGGYFGHSGHKAYDDYGFSSLKFFEGITHPGWEQPPYTNDTIEFINFSYLTNVTKLIAGSLAALADLPIIDPKITITFPHKDSVYVNGNVLRFFPLFKGKTVCFESVPVRTEVFSRDEIEKVVFELFTGQNEIRSNQGERQLIATYTDDTNPYEWRISDDIRGWHTLRTTVYTSNGSDHVDDMEIFFL